MIQIIPSILATTEEQFRKDLQKLSLSESLQNGWVHIDFADNIFVANKTVGPEIVSKFPTDFHKQAHLMVARPMQWIDKLIDSGFESIIFHLESEDNIDEVISYIKSKGKQVGLSLKQESSVDNLKPFIDKIDLVLVMTIVAGFQGQKLIPETLNKISHVKNLNSEISVGVDGGVSVENVKLIIDSSADFVIVGSHLLEGNVEENLENFWEVING